MLNVHLTPDDIARVTVASTCGQLSEAIFSLDVLKRRRSSRHNAWARDLSPAARQAGSSLSCLASSPIPIDLITLISLSTSLEAGVEAILEAPAPAVRAEIDAARPRLTAAPPSWVGDLPTHLSARRELSRTLAGYYSTALATHWPRVRAHLDAQAGAYARVLAKRGVDGFLSTLHPSVRWSPPTLVINRPGPPNDLMARGRGLAIVPVVFAQCVDVFHSVFRPDDPIVVMVPALRCLADAQAIWVAGRLPTSRALAALLGDTRAAALAVISGSCTTTELARQLGISPATASHHATVLRSAGLVMTQRLGSAVLHTPTPLGTQLLNGQAAGPAPAAPGAGPPGRASATS